VKGSECGSVSSGDGGFGSSRATLFRDPNAETTLAEARYTFAHLAREAAAQIQRQVAADITRVLSEEHE
jgi:hypothetical protein